MQDEMKSNQPESGGRLLCAKRSKKQKRPTSIGGKVTHFGASTAVQNGSLPHRADAVDEQDTEILTYEEVALYLPRTGQKRPVVIVGPPNAGCLELRKRLMESDKEKFAPVVPRKGR